jgi:hypothetical protein
VIAVAELQGSAAPGPASLLAPESGSASLIVVRILPHCVRVSVPVSLCVRVRVCACARVRLHGWSGLTECAARGRGKPLRLVCRVGPVGPWAYHRQSSALSSRVFVFLVVLLLVLVLVVLVVADVVVVVVVLVFVVLVVARRPTGVTDGMSVGPLSLRTSSGRRGARRASRDCAPATRPHRPPRASRARAAPRRTGTTCALVGGAPALARAGRE